MPKPKKEDTEGSEQLPVKSNYTGSVKILTEKGKQYGLNELQMKFCDLYINNNDLRGNGIRCYAEAYNHNLAKPGSYNICKSMASQLLTNEKVLNYLNDMIEAEALNDPFVDNQLRFIIWQNSDLQAKVQAIRVYNDLKGRIEKKQQNNLYQFNISIDGNDKTVNIDNDSKAA